MAVTPEPLPARRGSAVFTVRGWLVLMLGVLAASATVSAHQHDLARVAALLIALPLLEWLYLLWGTPPMSLRRTPTTSVTSVGEEVTTTLAVHRSRRGVPLILDDCGPPAMGGVFRGAIASGTDAPITTAYARKAVTRGIWTVGPARCLAVSPLGLASRPVWGQQASDVVVLPQQHHVKLHIPGLGSVGSGHGSGNGIAITGEPDLTVRQFRAGDGLRLVHWRSTARRGELMVRNTRHHCPTVVVLIVDTRACAHVGQGADSTLEWALSAAASIVVSLADHDVQMHLVGCGAPLIVNPADPPSALIACEAMAQVQQSSAQNITPLLKTATAIAGATHAMCVTGRLDQQDAATVKQVMGSFGAGGVLVAPVPGGERVDAPEGSAWVVTGAADGESVPSALTRWSQAASTGLGTRRA